MASFEPYSVSAAPWTRHQQLTGKPNRVKAITRQLYFLPKPSYFIQKTKTRQIWDIYFQLFVNFKFYYDELPGIRQAFQSMHLIPVRTLVLSPYKSNIFKGVYRTSRTSEVQYQTSNEQLTYLSLEQRFPKPVSLSEAHATIVDLDGANFVLPCIRHLRQHPKRDNTEGRVCLKKDRNAFQRVQRLYILCSS